MASAPRNTGNARYKRNPTLFLYENLANARATSKFPEKEVFSKFIDIFLIS